jgi:hypothetical protein
LHLTAPTVHLGPSLMPAPRVPPGHLVRVRQSDPTVRLGRSLRRYLDSRVLAFGDHGVMKSSKVAENAPDVPPEMKRPMLSPAANATAAALTNAPVAPELMTIQLATAIALFLKSAIDTDVELDATATKPRMTC